MKKLTLDRLLQSQGIGTRRHCQQLIQQGEVRVDGQVVDDPGLRVSPQGFRFELFGEQWLYREHVYIALYKPEGYECSRKPSHHPGVLSLLPEVLDRREVQPVGRLDHDTTGLLLLSDDGRFIHALSSPRRHVPKRYVATTAEPVTEALVARLLEGVQLHDEPAPLRAVECRVVGPNTLEIVLEQGKYHQVKRMLAAAGNHCAALHREWVGGLSLASLGLAAGEWCYLDEAELERLWRVSGDTLPG